MAEGVTLDNIAPTIQGNPSACTHAEEIDGDSISGATSGQLCSTPTVPESIPTQPGPYGATHASNGQPMSPIEESPVGRRGNTAQLFHQIISTSASSRISKSQHCRTKRRILCCTVILLLLSIFATFIPTPIIIINLYRQQHTNLALVNDVIDCDMASKIQKNFVSDVTITQKATDKNNDDTKGLAMNIATISRDDLNFRSNTYIGSSQRKLTKDIKSLVIPDGYINEPVYLWTNSNITIKVNISNHTSLPANLIGYIIRGDDNLNSFLLDPSSPPNYVHSWDVLDWNNKIYSQTINENGYYFIVVSVQTDHSFTLSAEVEFNYFYLSVDDYNISNSLYLDRVGVTVQEKLDFNNHGIVLCFVGKTTSDYRSIHVILNYNLRIYFLFIVSSVTFFLLIIMISQLVPSVLFCFKIARNVNICDCFQSHNNDNLANEQLQPLVT